MSAIANELVPAIIGDLIFIIGCALVISPLVFPVFKPKLSHF